jgi:hypothetical protein
MEAVPQSGGHLTDESGDSDSHLSAELVDDLATALRLHPRYSYAMQLATALDQVTGVPFEGDAIPEGGIVRRLAELIRQEFQSPYPNPAPGSVERVAHVLANITRSTRYPDAANAGSMPVSHRNVAETVENILIVLLRQEDALPDGGFVQDPPFGSVKGVVDGYRAPLTLEECIVAIKKYNDTLEAFLRERLAGGSHGGSSGAGAGPGSGSGSGSGAEAGISV